MEELFRQFCHYYIALEDESVLENLKEATQDNFKEMNKKVLKFVKNLRRKASKLGFGVDFEAFCDCLENYINIKDSLSDEEKKTYLKVLMTLSQIHEVNLREELERYVSVKVVDEVESDDEEDLLDNEENSRVLFKKLCLCTLNKDKDGLLKVKEEINSNEDVSYEEMELKAISFVKEIRDLTKRLGFGTTTDDFYKMVREYLNHKKDMNYDQKVVYLKILMYLSSVYDVNLRELLCSKPEDILKGVSNPLDDKELLSALLDYRYNNGNFSIEETVLASDLMLKPSEDYDYVCLQSRLVYDLLQIFLDKFNNCNHDELKQEFLDLINGEDIQLLSNLNEETIYIIIQDMKKGESSRYICKKYKLSDSVYKFMYLSVMEVTNLKQEYVGKISMFNSDKKKLNLGIFINGPEYEMLEFVSLYMRKCVENGICYDFERIVDYTQVVLYTSKDSLEKRLAILKEISEENIDVVSSFGCPLHMTGRIDNSFYGVASVVKGIHYVQYINDLLEVAYYRVVAKLVLKKIDEEKAKEIINHFIMLNNVVGNETKLASNCIYSGIDFVTIKDIINQYIPYVMNTLNIYMEDSSKKEDLLKEFTKSILYVSNVVNDKSKKDENNIVFGCI